MKVLSMMLVLVALFVHPAIVSAATLDELQSSIKKLEKERGVVQAQAKDLFEAFDASDNKEALVDGLKSKLAQVEKIKADIEAAEQKIANGEYTKTKGDTGVWWKGIILAVVIIIGVLFGRDKKKGNSGSSSDNSRYAESYYSQENSFQRNEQGDLGTRDSKGGFTRHGD